MLEVFTNFICAFILAILGFYIIKKIIDSDEKLSFRNLLILTVNSMIIVLAHYLHYNAFSSILNFIINTITYKIIFNKRLNESFIATGILTLILLIGDISSLLIQINFVSMEQLQTNMLLYLISNFLVVIIVLILISIKKIRTIIIKTYDTLSKKDLHLNVIFILLLILVASSALYNIFINYKFNITFLSNLIIIFTMVIIGVIFAKNKENFNQLSYEYDILLSNVKDFENWIEKEQFMRHEYKNQLAVLYEMSDQKKVKDKIQEIINQNLNIDNTTVYALKSLPKGGLKAIMYYKSIIAQNNKINLTIDISINEKGILTKLKTNQIDDLAKILGIIYDNAIDAAKETKKKRILLEIYELDNKVNFVISNTFKKKQIVENRQEKGVSSKGKGHGNGLYFAKQILSKNKWLEEKNEIIDNYYIETITIKKSTSK